MDKNATQLLFLLRDGCHIAVSRTVKEVMALCAGHAYMVVTLI